MPDSTFPTEADPIRAIAAEVYIQAFPLLLTDAVRRAHPLGFHQFQIAPQDAESLAPGLSEDDARVIVASVWIDLSHEPVVVRIPRTGGRYISLTLFDTAGEPFVSVGSRTGDDAGLDLAVVGPRWRGELPSGLRARRAPSELVWAVSRIHAHSALDRAATLMLAKRQCLAVVPPTVTGVEFGAAGIASPASPLVRQVAEIPPVTFFHRLQGLLDRAPLSYWGPRRRRIEALLEKLDGAPRSDTWPAHLEQALGLGLVDGVSRIEAAALVAMRAERGGWASLFGPIAGAATTPLSLAVRAYLGLGAPSSEDLLVWVCDHDVSGQPLNGANNYRIHFEPGAAPPVDAYWCLHTRPSASYDYRNGLGSRSDLVAGVDGSLDLAVQRNSPSRHLAPNWLICPASRFSLIMRVYSPWPSAVQGAWRMPTVERCDQQDEGRPGLTRRRPAAGTDPPTECRQAPDAPPQTWRLMQ